MAAKTFFVGLAMGSYDHDYGVVHSLLALLRGRRVSKRIWLVTIEQDVEHVVSLLKSSLAEADGALMVEFPASMNVQDWTTLPAFDGADPLQPPTTVRPQQDEGGSDASMKDSIRPLEDTLKRLGQSFVTVPRRSAAAWASSGSVAR